MISVQNRLLQLSGNKIIALILMGCYLSACSPKVQPTKKSTPVAQQPEEEKRAPKKFTEATISLLVPFKLNEFKRKASTKAEVEKHAMAIDFYQGFKLGLDSAAASGLNFRLNVFDTKDDHQQLDLLMRSQRLETSNLVVGPVFPDGIKYLTPYSISHKLPIVSPLAAQRPEEFKNPNLISVVNNIDLHAGKIGNYITKRYSPQTAVAVLISTKSPGDEVLAQPLREYFLKEQKVLMPFMEFASVFTMETKINKTKRYVVMLSSSDTKFVTATLAKLSKMQKAGFKIDLFGHPEWQKQNYSIEQLQALNTVISSSYYVNFNSPSVVSFVKKYRKAYLFEPGEYAFKGFDLGLYFGRQLSQHGTKFMQHLPQERFRGLHNSLSFVKDEQYGFVNTSLLLLRYRGYALNMIE